jgi:hypothetical protein
MHFGDARAKHKEAPLEMLRAPAVGRVCTADQKVFITSKSVNDWCKENGVAPTSMKDELDRGGYLVPTVEGKASSKYYIGSGSTVPSGQARCYEFKYTKLFGDDAPLHMTETEDGVETETID